MSLLRATGIEAGVGSVTACRNLNLTLKPGEIWSVLGRNGVGKNNTVADVGWPNTVVGW